MAAALQLIPAGAKPLGGGVYQLPTRRRGTAVGKKKSKGVSHRVGFFSRQWVWYALALALADALSVVIFPDGPPKHLSVPALFLYAYGKMKNKPGACNAAYAIQGAHLMVTFGITEMMTAAAKKAMGR